jgi:hypothetical protein
VQPYEGCGELWNEKTELSDGHDGGPKPATSPSANTNAVAITTIAAIETRPSAGFSRYTLEPRITNRCGPRASPSWAVAAWMCGMPGAHRQWALSPTGRTRRVCYAGGTVKASSWLTPEGSTNRHALSGAPS